MELARFFRKVFASLPYIILLFLPLLLSQVKEAKRVFTRAFFEKANISVNTTQFISNYHYDWLSLAQGGEEPGANMLEPVAGLLTAIQPGYIRLDHVFDDDYYRVVKRTDGVISYDFTRLDDAVESIMKIGAKPFFVLSYMPSALAPNKTDPPDNWVEWQNLVAATVRHYSGREQYNIPDVYYEVWNEPDLESFGGWKYYGQKNYLLLYRYAALGVKNITDAQPFKIGGPATTNLYENWVRALVKLCQSDQLPLDFISYHQYSFYADDYLTNVNQIKKWLRDYPSYQNTDVFITEWGMDPEKNPVYNGNLAAAFQIAITSLVNNQISQAFSFEAKDGPLTNSWGVIGHESQGSRLKPRYFALNWIAELNDLLTVLGNGTYVQAIAGKSGYKITLLVTNYDPENKHQETVPIRFFNLLPGRYRITREFLGKSAESEEIRIDSSVYTLKVRMAPGSVLKIDLLPL